MSTADEIKKLNDLLKDRVITQEEFDSQKELAATDREVWKSIWSAGQGCAAIEDIPSIASLIESLKSEYEQTLSAAEAMLAETRY
mgnify:CR=1 FL=1